MNLGQTFQIKRVYEPAADGDGYRVLVDRLWPRGVTKQRAQIDEWTKDAAPSPGLRQWFHDNDVADSFAEFSARYTAELDSNPAVGRLQELARARSRITLLYASRQPEFNHAQVLLKFLTKKAE